jgi:hypothetical protein
MKRFRLSTLLFLIAIAALCVASLVQQQRASRREAALRARLQRAEREFDFLVEKPRVMERDQD